MKNYLYGRFDFKTDIGKVRVNNEDQAFGMVNSYGNVLLLVCDGMGGQNKGDFASSLALQTIVDRFKAKKKFRSMFFAKIWTRLSIREANKLIYKEAENNPLYKGMGTTLSMALLVNNMMLTCQIGDSRIYSLSKFEEFEQLSEDQTIVSYLYRTGKITKSEMLTHPKRHVLTNALGIYPSASCELKVRPYQKEKILLCSDGLYNNLPDNDIKNVIKSSDLTHQKVDQLISFANQNGGSDNIAVVLWEAQD